MAWARRTRWVCRPRRLRRSEPRIGLSMKDFAPVASCASQSGAETVERRTRAVVMQDLALLDWLRPAPRLPAKYRMPTCLGEIAASVPCHIVTEATPFH